MTYNVFLRHSSRDFDDIMLTDVYIFFYIFVYTYTCNDMRSVMLQINEYDDDDDVWWDVKPCSFSVCALG